jgi:glycosyltransferase involved in cell wall biosynthesis
VKIAIATVQVPFIRGGAEYLAENLKSQLVERGYETDIISMPFKWYPASTIKNSIQASQLIDLTEVNGIPIDLLICLKFPVYYTRHENKVLWLLHQHRQAYELFGTEYSELDIMEQGNEVRDMIVNYDNQLIPEHKKLFTISSTVSNRLIKYNGIDSTPLYHPPMGYENLHCRDFGDYVFIPGRLDAMKRQHILIEALRHTKTPVQVIIAGIGDPRYIQRLRSIIEIYGLQDKVQLLGLISENEKVEYYSDALCVYYGPYQEDYGYVTLEAFFSGKPVITHTDSNGPLEFVMNNSNGFVVEADPEAVAEKLDLLFENKWMAAEMGGKGRKLMKDLNIHWDHVIERLVK